MQLNSTIYYLTNTCIVAPMLTRRLLHTRPHIRTTSSFAKCPALVYTAAQNRPWVSCQNRTFHQSIIRFHEDKSKDATPVANKNQKPLAVGAAEAVNATKIEGIDVSNKEQRKADWAIIKEMGRYIWPKVGIF